MRLKRYVFEYKATGLEFALYAESRKKARAYLNWVMRDGGTGWRFQERKAVTL